MRRWPMIPLALAALLLLWPLSIDAGGIISGKGHMGPTYDLGGSSALSPERQCCSTTSCDDAAGDDVLRWTPTRLAACDGCLAFSGEYEQTWGLLLKPEFAALATPSSSCFDHLRDGGVLDFANADAYRQHVNSLVPAGRARPVWIAQTRFDLITPQQAALGGGFELSASMFLHTNRTWSNFAGWFDSSHGAADVTLCGDGTPWECLWSDCRTPTTGVPAVAADKWDAGTGGGCNASEAGLLLSDMLADVDPDLAHGDGSGLGAAVRYSFGRSEGAYYAPAVLADRRDPAYQAFVVEYARAIIARGWDAVSLTHKRHFYDYNGAMVQAWPVTGDGLGGEDRDGGSAGTELCDTIAEYGGTDGLGGCGPFSGPPRRQDGTAYEVDDDVIGIVEQARLLYAAGIPFHTIVNPRAFEGCPTSAAAWDSAYDDAACADAMDTGATATNEAPLWREIARLATWVEIEIAGDNPNSADLGSATGLSFAQIKGMLETPPAGAHAPMVMGWTGAAPFSEQRAVAPIVSKSATETNPPASVIPNPTTQPQIPLDVFVVMGQSLAGGNSTQNQDAQTGNVTSPTTLGLVSRAFRNFYPTFGPLSDGWIDANDWPCRDTQCVEAGTDTCADGTCNNECAGRTGAALPITGCTCDCGVTTASRNGWAYGSPWPALAKRWMEAKNREVTFVPTAVGDTCLVIAGASNGGGGEPLWDPTVNCATVTGTSLTNERGDLYCEMKRSITNSGTTPTAFLWSQGECDAHAGTGPATKAQYKAALTALADNLWADYGKPLIVAPIGLNASGTSFTRHGGGSCSARDAAYIAIHDAQTEVIAEHAHVYAGPSAENLEYESDCTHIFDNQTWGARWADAIQAAGAVETVPPALAASFTATPLQGTSCVAPCVVHFDGGSTDSPDYEREFHQITYRWDFGDPGSAAQSWWHTAETGITRNEDRGPIVGHVYESPGTYTATLTATDPAGNVSTTTRAIVVADPDVVFSGTTYCVSTSGTFTGCTGTPITSSDFDAALATAGVAGAKRRVLFRGGETFTNSAITSLVASSAPGLIGSYGTGKANVTLSGANWFLTMRAGWQVTGLAFNCGATECGLFTREVGAGPGFVATPINNAGFYDISITGPVAECASAFGSGSLVRNHDAWFVGNTCEKTANSTTGTQFVIGVGDRNLFLGNALHVNNRQVQQLVMRVLFSNSAVSHNEANSPGADTAGGSSFRGILQLRADSTGVEPVPNTRNEVAYNKFAVRNGPTGVGLDWTKICSHHSGCDTTTAEGDECSDVIYENNLHTIDGTPGQGVGSGVHIQCADTTVRNNVFDLQGQGSQTTPSSGPVLVELKAKPTNVASVDRVEVYGNTAYVTGEGNNFTACNQGTNAGTNHRCAANLAYLPSHGGTRTETVGSGWTNTAPANDLRTTPIPSWWTATPAAQGLTSYLDFLGSELTCDITAASITQAGAQRGCIIDDPLIGMNTENGAKYTEVLPHTGATITNFKDVFANSALNRGDGTSGLVWEAYQADDRTTRRDDYSIVLDANGWPTETFPYDPSGAVPSIVARTKLARSAYLPAGTYELSFTGSGTVHVEGAVPTADCTGAAEPCSMTLTPSWDGITLWITSGTVTDIHFVPSAYVATYAAAPLHPDLVSYYDDFEGFRAMDWTRTNHHPCDTGSNAGGDCVTSWASRTTTTDQQNTTKGMAWEYVALLANEADVNPWINVPHGADDAYVTALATLLHDDLETDKTLTIELSNETWNSIFGQYTYFLALANARGYTGTDAQKRRKAIVARLAEVTALFRSAWGEDAHRIIPVMGIQGVAADATEMMTYWDSATYNPTGETLAALAFPLYATDSGQVSDGFSAGDITTTFSELDSYLSGTILPGLQALEAVASANNLQLFATEGGTLLDGATADANDELAAINADARMGVFIESLLDTFRTTGGDRFMAFNAAAWSSYVAAEGYVEYLGQTPTPSRYQALLDKLTEWAAP